MWTAIKEEKRQLLAKDQVVKSASQNERQGFYQPPKKGIKIRHKEVTNELKCVEKIFAYPVRL
jgi:hypothetical protein